jgi:Outer membrane protein
MKRFLYAVALASCATAGDAITLEALLQRTLQNNPEIRSAKANMEQAFGQKLVFHSRALPDAVIGLPAGLQGGHRSTGNSVQPFGFAYGIFTQPLFNMAVPSSWRRGDIEVLIAEQRLNVAVVDQLHAARIGFYTAIYNRDLKTLRQEQYQQLRDNAASQQNRYQSGLTDRGTFVASEVQTLELEPRIETAQRAYEGALLKLSEAIGLDSSRRGALLEPEGSLKLVNFDVSVENGASIALNRPDLQLARLLVRADNEDQRIIEAAYYPVINAVVSGDYIPVSGVRRLQTQGSPRRSDDFVSSEIRAGAAYTWRVIDNGKISGAVAKQRAAREMNEVLLQKMERDVPQDLLRIRNNLDAIALKQRALQGASAAAEQNASTLRQNLEAGVASQLEFRSAENDLLEVRTGLLTLAYLQSVARAEWDRATGRYLQLGPE